MVLFTLRKSTGAVSSHIGEHLGERYKDMFVFSIFMTVYAKYCWNKVLAKRITCKLGRVNTFSRGTRHVCREH